MFNLNIQYHLAKTNKATDALSRHPENPDSSLERNSYAESKDMVGLSYTIACENIALVPGDFKIHIYHKKERQFICNVI